MRFHSTPESALNGEITKLAIIECLASVTIYVSIGVYFGTFKYLAVAVIAAPLMLFRTEASSDWGLRVFARYTHGGFSSNQSGLWFPIWIFAPIVGIGIRIFATLFWTVRQPIRTLSEMPQNWLRQSVCTDFFHPPEILPLEAIKGKGLAIPTFQRALYVARHSGLSKFVRFAVFWPYLIACYVPPLIYRVSFKATVLVYLPLIWVAHATLRNPMPAKLRLERITKGELEKLRRIASWGILGTLLAKLGFVLGIVDWSRVEERFPSKKLVQSLVIPTAWPWWQLSLAADALLTFFLLFFADAALARLNTQHSWREQRILGTISTVSFLRAALSLVTISHFFRIALIAVAPGPLQRLLAG